MTGSAVIPPLSRGRLRTLAIGVACLLAAGPLASSAVHVLLGPAITWVGDQALVELGVREAGAFHRSLGVYSRFGWNHPGPVWLYLLAGPYRLLGADGRALGGAVAAWHALFAALIVVCAARLGPASRPSAGAGRAFAAALAIVLLQRTFGRSAFLAPWNPWAVVLPALLFLLLAAGVLLRRRGWFVGAVAVATVLVQTHLGTVPLVAVVAGLALLVRAAVLLERYRGPRRRPRSIDRSAGALLSRARSVRLPRTAFGRVQVGGWLLIVLAWLPPLAEQVFGAGNLRHIAHFVSTSRHTTSWTASTSVVGQSLYRSLISQAPGRLIKPLPTVGGLGVLVVCVGVGFVLGALGYGMREPVSRACAAVTIAGLTAGVLAAHQTVGSHDPYLMFWLAVCPAPLAVGTAALVPGILDRLASASRRATPSTLVGHGGAVRQMGVLALAVSCLVLAAPLMLRVSARQLSEAGNSVSVADERIAVERWLGPQHDPLLVRIHSHRVWPQVAGLLLQLRADGHPTYVTPNWVSVFGGRQRLPEPTTLVLDAASHGTPYAVPAADAPLGAEDFGPVQLALVRVRVPALPQTVPAEGP